MEIILVDLLVDVIYEIFRKNLEISKYQGLKHCMACLTRNFMLAHTIPEIR